MNNLELDGPRFGHLAAKVQSAMLAHPFFSAVKVEGFDARLLHSFVEQYEFASKGFRKLLGLAIASVNDESARAQIVDNLWDEYGQGTLSLAHHSLLARFNDAAFEHMAHSDSASGKALPETAIYLRGLNALAMIGDGLLVVGALWFLEAVTPSEYSVIVSGLRRSYSFSDHEVAFFLDHIGHDGAHLNNLNQIVTTICRTQQDWHDFESGVAQASVLEAVFWNGVLADARTK